MTEEIKLLRNGVEVQLKNPGTKGLKDFLVLARNMSKMPQDKPEAFMEYLNDEAIDAASNLITLTLKKTYKDFSDEDDEWGMENAMLILPKVIEMCSPKTSDDTVRREKRLAELKEDVKSA